MSSAAFRLDLSSPPRAGSFALPINRELPPTLRLTDYIRPDPELTDAPEIDHRSALARRTSPWTLKQKIARAAWMIVWTILFRPSFHNLYLFRRLLLRAFGAKVGPHVRVRPSAWIEIPWHVTLEEGAIIGDGAILYSLGPITIGRFTTISQYAHLCAGTHDHTSQSFDLIKAPITIGDNAWVATDAFVGPGTTIGDRSVVAARSVVTKDVASDQVVAGNPARFIKPRIITH
jgi:putative colanic acid biosynthesis acetyltransferase WcaF